MMHSSAKTSSPCWFFLQWECTGEWACSVSLWYSKYQINLHGDAFTSYHFLLRDIYFYSITRSIPWLAKRSKFKRRKDQEGISGHICTVGYGNPAQRLCCETWPPGFLTPCQDETWAYVPCICTPWFLQGLARRDLPNVLLGTWPRSSGISMAREGHPTWRLNNVSLPFLCSLPARNLSIRMPPPYSEKPINIK